MHQDREHFGLPVELPRSPNRVESSTCIARVEQRFDLVEGLQTPAPR